MATWQPGDAPHKHPLWEEQVQLELDMMQAGREAFLARLGKARERSEMTTMAPHRRIMESMICDMAAGLKAWVNRTAKASAKAGRGTAPLAFFRLREVPPETAAFVTIRTVLDGIGAATPNLKGKLRAGLGALTMSQHIGLSLEHEARMDAWFAKEPKLFHATQRRLKEQKATEQHKARVNINRFNALMREPLEWQDWPAADRQHTGLKLLDIMCRTTGHFELVEEIGGEKKKQRHHGRYVLLPSQELLDHLIGALRLEEQRSVAFLPTLMPPKRWVGVRGGGYYTPLPAAPKLIRFKADNEETRGGALDDYDALDMPRANEALSKIQEVPWRINERVLAIVLEAWDRDLGLAGLMRRDPVALPPKPPGMNREDLKGDPARRTVERAWMDAHELDTINWKRAASKVYGDNARRLSSTQAVTTIIKVAERFRGREFYFPHMLDFRGRMYPIPSYLQPQGNDLARGLLTFGKGLPITLDNGGAPWLAIHLANVWGVDKISFEDRITFVEDNAAMWQRIAENPLGNLEWAHQTDDCWQSLAAIFEWARYLREGDGMVSSLPVRVDGTCNGIQHLSCLMRDASGGASVNLTPGDKPRDIYKEVADALQVKLEGIEAAGGEPGTLAGDWLEGLDRDIPRSLTKNPVMVLPYGGTKEAYFKSIKKWLKKNDPEGTMLAPERRHKAIAFLVSNLWDTVTDRLEQPRACMEWLKACAEVVAVINQPIMWTTATGFHVRHFYGTTQDGRVETKVDGRRVRLQSLTRSKKLSTKDQLQGISPNFVHSQDACVNMETILSFMEGKDPPPFTSIHDAFGTLAASMWPLHHRIREAFISVHSEDVLEGFRQRCVAMLRDHLYTPRPDAPEMTYEAAWEAAEDAVPRVPPRGSLDLEAIRNADYFFA